MDRALVIRGKHYIVDMKGKPPQQLMRCTDVLGKTRVHSLMTAVPSTDPQRTVIINAHEVVREATDQEVKLAKLKEAPPTVTLTRGACWSCDYYERQNSFATSCSHTNGRTLRGKPTPCIEWVPYAF